MFRDRENTLFETFLYILHIPRVASNNCIIILTIIFIINLKWSNWEKQNIIVPLLP